MSSITDDPGACDWQECEANLFVIRSGDRHEWWFATPRLATQITGWSPKIPSLDDGYHPGIPEVLKACLTDPEAVGDVPLLRIPDERFWDDKVRIWRRNYAYLSDLAGSLARRAALGPDGDGADLKEWQMLGRSSDEARRWANLTMRRLPEFEDYDDLDDEDSDDEDLDDDDVVYAAPRGGDPLPLQSAINLVRHGLSIDQAETLVGLPSFDTDAQWRNFVPGHSIGASRLGISKYSVQKRFSLQRLVTSAVTARSEQGLAAAVGQLVDALLTPKRTECADEAGIGIDIRGVRYQVAWVSLKTGLEDKTIHRLESEPGLALLRNDVVLGLRGSDPPSQSLARSKRTGDPIGTFQVGHWRARYARGSTWFKQDLRWPTTDDLRRFANDASSVIRELFTDDRGYQRLRRPPPQQGGLLGELDWELADMVAHPAGDFLEERFGFDLVRSTVVHLSDQPEWWRRFVRNGLDILDITHWTFELGDYNDAAWEEVVRILEGWPSSVDFR